MYTYDPSNIDNMHKNAVNRLDVERQFGRNSHNDNSDNDSRGSGIVGEITGARHKDQDIDRGLPMRAQYTAKKPIYDQNKYLDFNLHSQAPKTKSNVKYSESNNYSSFADINASTTTLSNQIDPLYIINNSIDKLGSNINEYFMSTLSNSNYLINTIGLYSLFGALYIASDHVTQNEIEKFFNYPRKEILHKTLHQMFSSMANLTDIANIKNFMVADKKIPYNPEFGKTIRSFCIFSQVDITNPVRESQKFNYIIDNMMQTQMRNPILPSNLQQLQVMFMSVANIHPIWTYSFEKIVKGIFQGYEQDRQENFLLSFSRSYLYCEDNENQLIEFKCGSHGEIGFGIVLPKKAQKMVTNENIRLYISHAKQTVLDEIRIPMFTQNLKLRYNNTLKKLGLNSVFLQITAEDLFPQRVQLHDIIQNVKITVDNSSFGSTENTRGQRSMIRFIANKPFMYYVRSTGTDTIMMNGNYI